MALPAIDRFSALPDALLVTILSLLPTRVSARTSVLSRRFRDLWKNSPSVELISRDMPCPREENFFAVADRVLLSRDADAHPLFRLRLEISKVAHYGSFVSSLIVKVCTFRGLHNLTVEGWSIQHLLPDIFSMKSLESLSLDVITSCPLLCNEDYGIPSAVSLTRLRSLSLILHAVDPSQFHRLISELCSLEDLYITVSSMDRLSIASNTIRKLHLVLPASYPVLDIVILCLPSLEELYLENEALPQIQGEIPLLTKAILNLGCIHKEDRSRLVGLMNYVSHVQELSLRIKEDESVKYPFLILLESGKELPQYPNLKHCEVTMCFCEHNLREVISMLHCSPVLESVKLVDELPEISSQERWRTRKDWKSKLSHNADGNYSYSYFRNLHLGANRLNFLKALSKKCDPQSQA